MYRHLFTFKTPWIVILCLAALQVSAAEATVTIDFVTPSTTQLPYTEQGLTFTDVTGNSPVTIGSIGGLDGALIAGTNDIPIHVRASSDIAFDLLRLEIPSLTRTWRVESSSGAVLDLTGSGTVDLENLSGWQDLTYFDLIHDPAQANGSIQLDKVTVTFIPEPASLALLGLGGLAMLMRRRPSGAIPSPPVGRQE